MWVLILLLLAGTAEPKQNVHAGLGCASCHLKSHNTSTVVRMCGRCHAKEAASLEASQHGMAADGGPNCMTCHGAHTIKTASEIERQCMKCHPAPPLFFTSPVKRVPGKVSCMNCHSAHTD